MPDLTDASKPISAYNTEDDEAALRAQFASAPAEHKAAPINRRRKQDREAKKSVMPPGEQNLYSSGMYIPAEYLNDN